MIQTYGQIQTKVLTYLDQAGDTGQGQAMVQFAIQTAHNKRLSQERWSFMLWPHRVPVNFKTGQREYTLHPLALMLTDFYNFTARQQMHEVPTRARYKNGVQDDRYHFEFVMDSPTQLPTIAGPVTVAGSAQITYVDTSLNQHVETLTNAATSLSVDTIVGVTHLDTNPLTLTDAASVQILSLLGTEFGKTYPQIHLFDDGVTSELAYYRFYRRPKDLTNPNDIPDIPYPFSEILVFDALLELYTYNDAATPPQYWVEQQAKWELRLQQAYQEGEMEGSESRIVQEVDTYQG